MGVARNVVFDPRLLAQRFGKVRLQRGHRHAAVFAGVDAVTRMATTHGAAG